MPKGVYIHKLHSKVTKIKISNTLKRLGIKPPFITNLNKKYFTKEEKLKANRKKQRKWKLQHFEKVKLERKVYRKRYKQLRKNAGKLTIQIIQQTYEDNIKQFGMLTCYLCLKPIEFGQDSLEHKIPLSYGGTNNKENLDIAHRRCNSIKGNKTPFLGRVFILE